MVNTHKDVFAQLAKCSAMSIDASLVERLQQLAVADEIHSCDMATAVEECIHKHLASDSAVKVLDRVLYSLQREELEHKSQT